MRAKEALLQDLCNSDMDADLECLYDPDDKGNDTEEPFDNLKASQMQSLARNYMFCHL